jgi:glutamate/tyrosine decarboxylase-like PLP-dependent enzyme
MVKMETAGHGWTDMEKRVLAMLWNDYFSTTNPIVHETICIDDGLPKGIVCSGGTIANITALWIARNRALPANHSAGFKGVEKEGLVKALQFYGFTGGAVILGSKMMHYSIKKAACVLGLGEDAVIEIETDKEFCVR